MIMAVSSCREDMRVDNDMLIANNVQCTPLLISEIRALTSAPETPPKMASKGKVGKVKLMPEALLMRPGPCGLWL